MVKNALGLKKHKKNRSPKSGKVVIVKICSTLKKSPLREETAEEIKNALNPKHKKTALIGGRFFKRFGLVFN